MQTAWRAADRLRASPPLPVSRWSASSSLPPYTKSRHPSTSTQLHHLRPRHTTSTSFPRPIPASGSIKPTNISSTRRRRPRRTRMVRRRRRILPAPARVRRALPVLSARHIRRLLRPPYERPPPPRLQTWKSCVQRQHRIALLVSLALLAATASNHTQPCATSFCSPRAALPSSPFRPPP